MPAISIVMPCYNAANTILETLDSIRAQTLRDWELICVDDGSTDLTKALITDASKQDKRIKLAQNPGKGTSSARNFGAAHLASGAIISFCDADDVWTDHKLADVAKFFRRSSHDATFGQVAFFISDPSQARVYSAVSSDPLSIQMLLRENPVCTMSNLSIRAESFAKYSGFDPKIVHSEYLEWLIRVVGHGGTIRGIRSLHVWYRSSPNGLSADQEAMQVGRAQAIATACSFGVSPSRSAESVHHRFLTRRALRLGHVLIRTVKSAIRGIPQSPRGLMTRPNAAC